MSPGTVHLSSVCLEGGCLWGRSVREHPGNLLVLFSVSKMSHITTAFLSILKLSVVAENGTATAFSCTPSLWVKWL